MKNIQVKVYLCCDEHGNYRAIGSSAITDLTEHEAIAIIESDIKKENTGVITTTFKVNAQLPEPYKEEKDEIDNVSK